jgi:hypothetical protein
MKNLLLPPFLATCIWLAAPAVLAQPDAKKASVAKPKQVATVVMAAEVALEPRELAIAEHVHTGVLRCELGVSVTLTNDPRSPGYFNVQGKNFHYRMSPVATSTGAIRLEDRTAGAVWLQLSHKSMLMSQKAGQRLADECMSPAQLTVAQAMRDTPGAGLLD